MSSIENVDIKNDSILSAKSNQDKQLENMENKLTSMNTLLMGAIFVIGLAFVGWLLNTVWRGNSFRENIIQKINLVEQENIKIENKIEFLDEKINLLRDNKIYIQEEKFIPIQKSSNKS